MRRRGWTSRWQRRLLASGVGVVVDPAAPLGDRGSTVKSGARERSAKSVSHSSRAILAAVS